MEPGPFRITESVQKIVAWLRSRRMILFHDEAWVTEVTSDIAGLGKLHRRRFQPRRAFRQGDAPSSSFLQLGSVSTRAAGRSDLLRVRGASHPSREHHLPRTESARASIAIKA